MTSKEKLFPWRIRWFCLACRRFLEKSQIDFSVSFWFWFIKRSMIKIRYIVKEIMRENTKHFVKNKQGALVLLIKSLAINASRIPNASIPFEWVSNIFFIAHKISNTMLEVGWNKGSLQSPPQPLWADIPLQKTKCKFFPRVREYRKIPPENYLCIQL